MHVITNEMYYMPTYEGYCPTPLDTLAVLLCGCLPYGKDLNTKYPPGL